MSSTWTVILDPPAVAINRAALSINELDLAIDQAGIDFGDSQMQAYEAEQQQWGSTVVDGRWPNRNVTIPLLVSGNTQAEFDAATEDLRQKVALFQREGGWLERSTAAGPAMYADVVNATLTLPDKFGETGLVEPNISLVLECLPDFYGDPVTLDAITGTGKLAAVLTSGGTQAAIRGDHPGRAQITVTDTSGNDQHALIWGIRSRHYDPAGTAGLFYEAESLTPLSGAAVIAMAGASGGNVVALGFVGDWWVPMLSTDLLAGGAALTHQGSYNVWARVSEMSGLGGRVAFRLLWGPGSLSAPITNAPVEVPGSDLYVVNLGQIRIDPQAVGANAWYGAIQAMGLGAPLPTPAIDCVYLQPLDEGAGQLSSVSSPSVALITAGPDGPSSATNDASIGTVPWVSPTNIGVQDGAFATAYGASGSSPVISEFLKAEGFGFAVPSGANISGIAVTWYRSSRNFVNLVWDKAVRLVKAGAIQTPDRANPAVQWNRPPVIPVTYGSPTDLWGATWTAADVNDPTFGAALAVTLGAGGVGATAAVDYVQITVYYTMGTGFIVAQDAVMYADQACALRYNGCSRAAPAGVVYGPVSRVIGDLPRIPPSGMEGRPVEILVKPSRGDLNTLPDAAVSDSFTAQVTYRPSWIFRP